MVQKDSGNTAAQDIPLDQLQETKQQYSSVSAAKTAFKKHGSTILETLGEESLIESDNINDLNLAERWIPETDNLQPSNATVDGILAQGTATAHIQVLLQKQEYSLSIFVQPQLERAFAHLNETDTLDNKTILIRDVDKSVNTKSTASLSIDDNIITTESGKIGTRDFCSTSTYCLAGIC